MIGAISGWWQRLSLRERWLVGIAAALTAIVIGLFLIAFPIQSALVTAREAHGVALDRQAGIAARVAEIQNLEARRASAPAAPGASAAALELVLAQGAAERGFTLSRNEPQGNDAASIAIANGRAPALIGWISELESAGVLASDLTLRPNADGTVALTATLRRPQ